MPIRSHHVTLCSRVRWDGMDVLRIPAAVTSRLPGRLGESVGPPVVSVVRMQGVISAQAASVPRQVLNISSMEKVLERAFAPERLAAVALVINSPGGSPTQSQLIGDRVRSLAAEKDVPVLAFCEDVAASGGYWLACAADEIYSCSTSIVGSIGVISAGFGLDGLIERWGVSRRLHTAGGSKSRLDPFLPERSEDVAGSPACRNSCTTGSPDGCASGVATGSRPTPSCSTARCGWASGPASWAWWTASAAPTTS